MFGSIQGGVTEMLLFLAIVGLTVVSTIDLPCGRSNKRKTSISNIDEFDCRNKMEWMR